MSKPSISIPRANDYAIRSILTHTKVLAVTGCLGSGKTHFLKGDCARVAQSQHGWAVGWVDRQCNSIFKVLDGLASELNTPKFNNARQAYIDEFKKVNSDTWITVLETLAPAAAQTAVKAAQVSGDARLIIAALAGSVLLNQQVIEKAVAAIRQTARRRRWGGLLANQPLDRLCQELEKDLAAYERVVFLLDDFELSAPFLRDWLASLISEGRPDKATWVVACWGGVPDWLGVQFNWQLEGFSYRELQKIKPGLRPERVEQLQGPPIFGLPLLAAEWNECSQSRYGEWQPMIRHLEDWLQAQFNKCDADMLLDGLLRCSVSRYLDEGVVTTLWPGDGRNLWKWIDSSPLVVPNPPPGFEYKAWFDERIRSSLTHELWRRNEKEYFALHNRLREYHEEALAARYMWHHQTESLYHKWCVLATEEEILRSALNRVLDNLGSESDIEYDECSNVGRLLIDIASERPSTRSLLKWGRLIQGVVPVIKDRTEPDWERAWDFYDTIRSEAMQLLDRKNRGAVWFGLGMASIAQGEYGEAIDFLMRSSHIMRKNEDIRYYLSQAREMYYREIT